MGLVNLTLVKGETEQGCGSVPLRRGQKRRRRRCLRRHGFELKCSVRLLQIWIFFGTVIDFVEDGEKERRRDRRFGDWN